MLDRRAIARDLLHTANRVAYLESVGFTPFAWQARAIGSGAKRKWINGARQSGKSTIISLVPCHGARFFPRSLHVVLAATEKQAVEDMEKIADFIRADKEYPEIVRQSDEQLELVNGSRILVVPGTEKGARGFSSPMSITMDEASRIADPVYKSGIRAMLTDNPDAELNIISTPNGRTGFFHDIMASPKWFRMIVRAPWGVRNGQLVETASEEDFRAECSARGIEGYYSPRHRNREEQEEHLGAGGMGEAMYRQEMLCEFVEPETQVFRYDEIERAFSNDILPLIDLDGIPEALHA